MDLDDPVCLCFRVSRRKLLQFARIEHPRVASQLSECGGAGTGCGWCVPYLVRLFADPAALDAISSEDYFAGRARHRAPKTQSTDPRPASAPMTDAVRQSVQTWLADFASAPSAETLSEAFGEVIASEPENVSVRVATIGLAAGEVVAAMAGGANDLPAGVGQWAKENSSLANELVVEARIAVQRVGDGAEVAGLGNTPSEDVAGCKDAAMELLTRL